VKEGKVSTEIDVLARFVAETRWEDIPGAVQAHAKLVFLDTLGVVLAGSVQPEVQAIRQTLCANGGTGATVYAPGWPGSDPRQAALLNGIAGRSIELCEGHRYVSCQAAIQILPTVLALGEQFNRPGHDLLSALILGYDTAVRIGAGATMRALGHQNGQHPMLGAVAAGARLRGCNAEQTSRALRLGATLLLTPSYTNAVAGATILNVAGGMSGFVGALAPELAMAGFAAQEGAVEEAFSQLVGDGYNARGLTDELGQRWEIQRNYFRVRACCNPIYASLDALEAALAELQPEADAIDRIDVETYSFAANMNNQEPPNTFAARYSLPHAAAATVLRGDAGYGSFTDAVLHDPRVVALRRRVHVREDPQLSADVPRIKPARVTLKLKDGRQCTHTCESARGDFQRPYSEADIRRKFHDLAGLVLTAEGGQAVEAAVQRAEHWPSVQALLEVFPLRLASPPSDRA
jgi:2-methylcitrate dehydratase PrpD